MHLVRTVRSALLGAALLAAAGPARAAEVDKYLPNDAEAVLTINVKQALAAPLLKGQEEAIKGFVAGIAGDVQATLSDLGFDPFKDLDRVVIALAGGSAFDKGLIIVHGKFDTAKFKAKAAQAAKDSGDAVKVHKAGDHSIYEFKVPDTAQSLYGCLMDDKTLVVGLSKSYVTDALDKKAGKQKTALKKDLQQLLEKADPKTTLSLVALSSAVAELGIGDQFQHLTGGITVGEDIKAEFVITTKDAEAARGLEETLKSNLDQFKQLVQVLANEQKELAPVVGVIGTLKTGVAGNTVTLKSHITKEMIEEALKKN